METTVKVGEQSKDLIEILKQFNIAYNMFMMYMNRYYGEKHQERKSEDEFYDKWCEVTSVVEDHLCKAMLWELRETDFTSI